MSPNKLKKFINRAMARADKRQDTFATRMQRVFGVRQEYKRQELVKLTKD